MTDVNLETELIGNEEDPGQQTEPEAPPAETGEQVEAQSQPEGDLEPEPQVDPIEHRLKGLESAIADERGKRQASERETAYLRGQLDTRQSQPTPSQPEIDWKQEDEKFWASPAEYTHNITQAKAQEIAQRELVRRDSRILEASASRMARKHEDYSEKEALFLQHAHRNPALYEQILSHPEPAQAMYDMVTQYQNRSKLDPVKLEAEIRSVEAEMRKDKAQKAVAGAPTTQAGVRGTGTAAAPDGDPFEGTDLY